MSMLTISTDASSFARTLQNEGREHDHDPFNPTRDPSGSEVKADNIVSSLSDERYGRDEPGSFADETLEFLTELHAKRLANKQEIQSDWGSTDKPWEEQAKQWDAARESYCNTEDKLRMLQSPQKYNLDPEVKSAVSANPVEGLSFNPMLARSHFRQYRCMLAEYYEGTEALEGKLRPSPTADPDLHAAALQAIAVRFARKIVHQRPFALGVLGTSVLSGQDNCYALSYAPTWNRTLRPLLDIVGVPFDVHGSGQNGNGPSMGNTLTCAKEVLGDVDIVHTGWWMVGQVPKPDYEAFLRRMLTDSPNGPLVHSIDGFRDGFNFNNGIWLTEGNDTVRDAYYKAGVMEIASRPEWNYLAGIESTSRHGDGDYPWFPLGFHNAHWGRVGDGKCHRHTREGEDATIMQNWHPGPLGVQVMMDLYLYTYLKALEMAMEWIERDGVQALKERFPLHERPSVELPSPKYCARDANEQHPMCRGETDGGWLSGPFCGTGQRPMWGAGGGLQSWLVDPHNSSNPHQVTGQIRATWCFCQLPGRP
ncbi:hypothetical protein CYMTET_31521 [Cymbomonas tetramitiformis]|uniref:Uncharacterized protein n=1 Tax=Cymbomonas tetramitiformis TaxID=36881 RepID=A0AAE0FHC8_9CHLO|nr:hypothetical protein CYMTET_31521 [Cymbomonas tetramitiformis]